MAPQQRIKVANEKASKNITLRGNVPKSTVSPTVKPINYLILGLNGDFAKPYDVACFFYAPPIQVVFIYLILVITAI